MDDLLDPLLDARFKGFPATHASLRRSQVGAQGWHVLAGDLPLPLAVVRRSALQHNLGWMQRFVADHGIALAPHGKTTMSPQLFQAQLEHGAWGITFATVGQMAIGVAAGVRRCLIANQVLTALDLGTIAALCDRHADLRVLFLLDSAAQLALVEGTRPARPFEVLIEVGVPGGRTGCRGHDEALALARLAHASAAVRLCGIECYEGLAAKGDTAADSAYAAALMQRVQALASVCDGEGLFDSDECIVSAGGSGLFDLVAPALRPTLSRPVQGLLRSGCYVTHDQGHYRRLVSLVNQRIGCGDGLQAAMEVWATVQSMPEPGLALLTAGRRDISFDMGLPMPVAWCPRGQRVPQPAPAGWSISGLNDQHAHLRLGDAAGALAVGDRVALGLSHPCTTFDKWRWMPIVDDDYRVVDALVTWF
ncbi:alanine racemase [Ideonella sp. A 288]|uniref:alanine racemase n=1 Tax=Ideonella sp. A 288 TaxID=1962181 RepID=UPI000B4BFE42|nr:alanine racemase [Ideonella sp. A 288]